MLPQWHVKDPGHSAKSTSSGLHLNMHTPLTQRRSGLTMPLSKHSVGTYQEMSSHATRHHHHHHQFLNREGRWGTTDDFATSFLHFPLFSTALWDLPNSRPVHSQMLSSHLFLSLPCLLRPFTVPCSMVLAMMNGKHDHTTAVCVSLRWSGGLREVKLLAGSWHRLPRW